MADARRRAREKAGARPPEPPAPPPAPAAAPTPGAAPPAASPRPGTAPAARIELPPSGLAADILGREEAGAVTAGSPAPAAVPGGRAGERSEGAPQTFAFFAAPAREERAAVEATEHLATFLLDREEYGVEVRLVQEIRRVGEITQVPRAPDFVRGVMNLRGRIIPVIDLKRKLGIGDVAPSRAARIVVVRLQERLLGLLVDGASQVLKVPVSSVEAPPEEVVEKGGDYIRGVAKLGERLIILVDLAKVLARELGEAAGAEPRSASQDR
jgi:purine-binding chemotaxis protein CheW